MWASARAGDDQSFEDDADFFNLPESWRRKEEKRDFIVNHDGWGAFEAFCACGTQWHYSMAGQRVGLNYQSLTSIAREWLGLETNRELLEQIQCLEVGALAAASGRSLQSVLDG